MRLPLWITILGAITLCCSIALGCSFDALIWVPGDSADPLYRIVENEKIGYIDNTGKIVITPTFRYSHSNLSDDFHEGRMTVFGIKDGKAASYYVDTKGNVAFPETFDLALDFTEGLAAVRPKDSGPFGYIDTDGRLVITPQFDQAEPFSDGVAIVEKGERTGYIDKKGAFVLSPHYLRGKSFKEDRAWVVTDGPCRWQKYFDEGQKSLGDSCFGPYTLPESSQFLPNLKTVCQYALIDKSGTILSQQRFLDVEEFSEGLAAVRIGKKWGFVDRSGRVVITAKFDVTMGFSEGLAVVGTQESGKTSEYRFGYIDRSGAFTVLPRYSSADSFSEGIAVVGDGKTYTYIDRKGNRAISKTYERAGRFFKGLAHVKSAPSSPSYFYSGTFAYITRQGNEVFSYRIRPE